MGNCWACVCRRRSVRRRIVLIMIGLDNAGKTKTVNNLAGEKDESVLPTIGFKAVNLLHKETPVTIYDLGGGPHFRQIWSQYYSEVHGVIFVIDSSDYSRLDECRAVLEEVLSHDKISGKPVLVLANKQDKSGALDDIDVVEKLNIEPLVNRYRCPTLVESYTAEVNPSKKKPKLDPGLKRGYHWLLNYIDRRYGDINLRVQTDIHADLERRRAHSARAANTASQTYTAISDEVTQTGFENPNYNLDKSDLARGVIVVKPHRASGDTTVTVDSGGSGAPKLSPLFGRASGALLHEARVELGPRSEFRKLSPLARAPHAGFQRRPQSSPAKPLPSQESGQESGSKGSNAAGEPFVPLAASRAPLRDEPPPREILFSERECNKTASSDVTPARRARAPSPPARPASAAQLVRRQLQLQPPAQRRRLSLRHIQRNKTSPEPAAPAPEPAKAARRRLDEGDCRHATD